MKVLTVIGTRPEIIRLSRVMARFDEVFEHVVVHTGQNYDYELSELVFDQLQLRPPDYSLRCAGSSPCVTVGNILQGVDEVLDKERPDAFLTLGDTNSSLSVYAAKRRKIPIFHMEAGNRCFDQRVPEEINRRIVDHVSDVNLPYSSLARDCLITEGLPPDRIIKTGSPLFEVLQYYRGGIDASPILDILKLRVGEFYLVSAHREELVDVPAQLERMVAVLNMLAGRGNRVIVTTHPRTRKRLTASGLVLDSRIELHKPFGPLDYLSLETRARAVLSDSGTITEESSILGFPALNLRETHERPEAFEEAAVMLTGLNISVVERALWLLENSRCGEEGRMRIVRDYDVPNVSEKVARIVLSYRDYVNRVVWG